MSFIGRLFTVAEMQGRDLVRRRLAIIILVALPLAFYLSIDPASPFAVVAGGIGMSWSVAAAALFAVLASRRTDPRLVLAGFHPGELLLGRLLLLEGVAAILVAVFSALMIAISRPPDPATLVLGVALAALVGVPFGLALASLLPRELEGTLAIIGIVGIELSLPTSAALAPFLPLYGPLNLLRVAAGSGEAVAPSLVHGLAFSLGLFLLAILLWTRRVRVLRATSLR